MRLAAAPLFLCLGACATGGPTANTGPVERCDVTDCFIQAEIRDFDALDDETLVVYAGAQRCPFLVELRGFDCNMSVAPAVAFVQRPLGAGLGGIIDEDIRGSRSGRSYGALARVCGYTRGLLVHTGPFDRLTRTPLPVPVGETCRVTDIRSVTDDELVEIYVNRDLAPPPPPAGSGQIQVVEEEQEGEAAQPADTSEDDTAQTDGESGGSAATGSDAAGESAQDAPAQPGT